MNDNTVPGSPHPCSYEALRSSIRKDGDGAFTTTYRDYRIDSHFQPIVSLTHARVIGHEGLMRPTDARQQAVAPEKLLRQVENDPIELLKLDRLVRMLHMANGSATREGWLFLNMHPQLFAASRSGALPGASVAGWREFGIDSGHIVIEILEHSLHDESQFADTVRYIRAQGCLVALDDFGAGHSNFDRVWKAAPDIVKLDRVFAVGAENDARIRRLLPRVVSLLHEAGVFVVLEGVETRTQAMIALDANIDFAQGYYFGMPQTQTLEIHSLVRPAADLWQNYESDIVEQQRLTEQRLQPYKAAIAKAAAMIAGGTQVEDACCDFLALPDAEFCYLLDGEGRQVDNNVWHPSYKINPLSARFLPISNIGGARWSRRPYFREAMDHIGTPQATRPYLSASSAHVCITISLAFRVGTETRVVCGDIVWE